MRDAATGGRARARHGRGAPLRRPRLALWRLRGGGKSLKALLAAAPLEGVAITRSRDAGRLVDFACT